MSSMEANSGVGGVQNQKRQELVQEDLWDGFTYDFMDAIFFDGAREKTALAMRHLFERMPSDLLNDLAGNVRVFAPSQHCYGQVFPAGFREPMIYLSPVLENQPQAEVDFTVAHEFAHAVLGHTDYLKTASTSEDDADALAASWGFTVPERRKIG
jgi:hypothetical protein